MEYGIFSSNEWIYPDTDVKLGKKEITLFAAKNSFACVQILLSGIKRDASLLWESESLEAPEYNRLLSVYVEKNTGERGFTVEQGTNPDYVTRKAPFWVFDAFEPITDNTVKTPEKGEVSALYLRWQTKTLSAGNYNGSLTVGSERIEVKLEVSAVEVPETETLRLTNWYSLENMAKFHGADEWSEKHWEQMKKYGKIMREARQTDFIVPFCLVSYIKIENGYVFDFSRTERFINMYLGLGFSYIEAETPIFRECWDFNTFVITLNGVNYPALSETALEFLTDYFRSWYAFLDNNGWLKITEQHIADEPHDGCAAEYAVLAEKIKTLMPNIPIIEAVEVPNVYGVDILVPKNNSYTEQQAEYEGKRAEGKTLWYYTCCCPGGKYLNRLLDEELLRTRYLHWANKLYNMNGYLHWGLNQYGVTDDPFGGHAGVIKTLNTTALPCGDSHIVYPLGEKVLKSVRFEMMRAGVEDYELLTLLSKANPQVAEEVLRSVIRSFTDYTTDIEQFESNYRMFLTLLS